jgi:protease-4
MKEFFRSFFASLLAMVVLGIIIFSFLIGMLVSVSKSFTDKEEKKTKGGVLVIDLGKNIHEQGQTNTLAALMDGPSYEAGLYDITKALARAKTDADIKGIYLKLNRTPNGWSELQQLRLALLDFKTSGKFIYAYGENVTQGSYFAATAADSIYVNPAGDFELKGLSTTLAFLKGTLNKLELEPQIFYAGKFKSATEPFREEKMTEPNRQQIQAIQKGLWNEYLAGAAQYTQTDAATINDLAVAGTVQFPSDALKYKMVAGLLYQDEVEARIRKKTGDKEGKEINYVSINDYVSKTKSDEKYSSTKIAVLFADGDIVDGDQKNERMIASKTFSEEIRKVKNNDNIKAVVLRINSPGGSALASEVILRELVLLRQKKPVVVSMGNYAASGGYYIASMADSIFAMPNTITGSIGVFGMMFNMDKLMKNKLGVTFDGVKNTPYADLPTATRSLTPEEAKRMQASVDTIYMRFKTHVANGRKLSLSDVDTIAQGRVWTGADAKDIGLVDGLGGLDRAILSASRIAKLRNYKVVSYPEPTDKFNLLLKQFSDDSRAKEAMKAAIKEELGKGYDWYEQIRSLTKMNGKAMMAMPFLIEVQ